MAENSAWRWVTALAIFSLASLKTAPMRVSSSVIASGPAGHSLRSSSDQRTDRVPLEGATQVARRGDVEHEDRQVVLLAEGEGGEVHHPQLFGEGLAVADLVVLRRGGIRLRIRGVDAVDAAVRA